MIKLYRKRPVTVEALQYTAENVHLFEEWMGVPPVFDADDSMLIGTLEGTMAGTPGDFIIKGIQGEFYPCKPDIFWLTYEVSPS